MARGAGGDAWSARQRPVPELSWRVRHARAIPKAKWAKDAIDLEKLAERCKLSRRSKLDELGGADVGGDSDSGDGTEQRPHDPVWSGEIVFCTICGAYAESKAVKLKGECRGKPNIDGSYGGAWGQHRKLTNGRHPRSNDVLPPPKRLDGSVWQPGIGKYLNLKSTEGAVDPNFYRYVPVPDKVHVPRVREIPILQLPF